MNDEQRIKRLQEISTHLTNLYKDVPIYPEALLKFQDSAFDILESRKLVVDAIDESLEVEEPEESEYKGNLPTIENIIAVPIPLSDLAEDQRDDEEFGQESEGSFSNLYKVKFFLKKTETGPQPMFDGTPRDRSAFTNLLTELFNSPPPDEKNNTLDDLAIVRESLLLIKSLLDPTNPVMGPNPCLYKYITPIEQKFLHPILGNPDVDKQPATEDNGS